MRSRGRKQRIAERLARGESPGEIATAENTTRHYVYNVRSELRRRGIELVGQRQHEEPDPLPLRQPIQTAQPTDEPTHATVNIRNGGVDVDPEVARLRNEIAHANPMVTALRERVNLRQTHRGILIEERRLLRLDDEARLESAIVEFCPNPRTELLNDESMYVRAMRRLLEEEPYRRFLQTLRWWSNDVDGRLNACLRAFYELCILQNKSLSMSDDETFLLDHVAGFFSYLFKPTHGVCRGDFTPRLPISYDWTKCAMGHLQPIQV